MAPTPGLTARLVLRVGDDDTATALGSGDVPVLATPRLVAWLEAAAMAAVAASLDPGTTTVGTRVVLDHRRATPVGALVEAHAEVVAVDGRQVRFAVRATHAVADGTEVVAEGEVTRAVVDRTRFTDRLPRP